jgi:Protein of unknown function (DUF2934)
MAGTPSREEIERRAYEIYEQRGREEGHALEHWVIAEQQCAAAAKPATVSRSTVVRRRTSR